MDAMPPKNSIFEILAPKLMKRLWNIQINMKLFHFCYTELSAGLGWNVTKALMMHDSTSHVCFLIVGRLLRSRIGIWNLGLGVKSKWMSCWLRILLVQLEVFETFPRWGCTPPQRSMVQLWGCFWIWYLISGYWGMPEYLSYSQEFGFPLLLPGMYVFKLSDVTYFIKIHLTLPNFLEGNGTCSLLDDAKWILTLSLTILVAPYLLLPAWLLSQWSELCIPFKAGDWYQALTLNFRVGIINFGPHVHMAQAAPLTFKYLPLLNHQIPAWICSWPNNSAHDQPLSH